MSNLEVSVPVVDGSAYYPHEFGESCKLAVETLLTDDFSAPPKYLQIEVRTESGKTVKVCIPYDHEGRASVSVDGEMV